MTRLFTRRGIIGAGGAAALLPVAARRAVAATPGDPDGYPAGPVVTLKTATRVYDSRTDFPSSGTKIGPGESIAVTVAPGDFAVAVFLNCSITETEGSGYLVLAPSDLSGEAPFPNTANINWWTSGITIGNAALVGVGGENAIEVACRGAGRTHFIIDLQGYIPFVP
jgi:hypothetical protein